MLLATTMVFVACAGSDIEPKTDELKEDQLNIYLLNSSDDALVEVAVKVDKSTTQSQVADVLHALGEGVDEENLHGTLPEKNMVENFEVVGDKVVLHVTESYLAMDEVLRLISRSSLIKSLTAIDGVAAIDFYINGTPLLDSNGKIYGPFYPEDIVTAGSDAMDALQTAVAFLYFPNESGEGLVKVSRTIGFNADEGLETKLIEELKHIPQGMALVSPIPEGAVVKSISVNDGICYIDFNEAFRSNHYGGSTGELMTAYSIVNTLTELPNISRVQFLIEGEKSADYKGHLDFSQLFAYNLELIEK